MKTFLQSSSHLLAAGAFTAFQATASTIPATCSELLVPPQTCEAEAQQCTGACPGNKSNSWSKQWTPYWDLCLGMKQKQTPNFSKTQFMCGPNGDKLEVVYFKPADRWICCLKNAPSTGGDNSPAVVPRTISPDKR
jgi:hypothetical protein